MNTRKAIKSEQDYVLSKAVIATPEEYPQLCRIFSDMMKAKPCGWRLTLMVGECHVAIRIKALGMLAKSEYYYELLGSELLGFGRWQITSDEYFEKIDHLFDPYMNFTEDDGKALGAFLGAALFIAGCRVGEVSWRSELDLLGAFGDPGELLAYASTEAAYERMVAVAASIHGMSHPLKHIVWNYVWDLVYRDWEDIDENERFDDFLATCERGQAVMPAAKSDACDEYIHCDGPYYADGFIYYDEIPTTDTHVA